MRPRTTQPPRTEPPWWVRDILVAGGLGLGFAALAWWLDDQAATRQDEFQARLQTEATKVDLRRDHKNETAANLQYLRETVLRANPHMKVFAGLNLDGADLSGLDLSCSSYERTEKDGTLRIPPGCADFSSSSLRSSRYLRTRLTGSSFAGADLRKARFLGADATGSDFTGADLRRAILVGRYRDAIFDRADMRKAQFAAASVDGTSFDGADLRGAVLSDRSMRGVQMAQTRLDGADLTGTDFRRAQFVCADIRGAKLARADLRGVDLELAIVRPSDLKGALIDRETLLPSDFRDIIAGCNDGLYMP